MRRKIVTALIIVWSVTLSAQVQPPPNTKVIRLDEAPIMKIGDVPRPPDPNVVPCGDYFVMRSGTNANNVAPVLAFAVMYPDQKMGLLHTIEAARIEVNVWPKARTPKALVHVDMGRLPWFEINISAKDFESSPCLKLAWVNYHA